MRLKKEEGEIKQNDLNPTWVNVEGKEPWCRCRIGVLGDDDDEAFRVWPPACGDE